MSSLLSRSKRVLQNESRHGGSRFDAAQAEAAARLDRLSASIRQTVQSAAKGCARICRWLPAPARTPQRGLYLWGGVGRGKTMLMDLFYESLRAIAARAHSLLSLHAPGARGTARRIKAAREPLEAVARAAGASARGCCAWMNSSSRTSPMR